MIFYNGFNLLVDLILIGVVSFIAYKIGRNDGYAEAWKKFKPPF